MREGRAVEDELFYRNYRAARRQVEPKSQPLTGKGNELSNWAQRMREMQREMEKKGRSGPLGSRGKPKMKVQVTNPRSQVLAWRTELN